MKKSQQAIFLAYSEVAAYKLATHYRGTSWPKSFLLTLWQSFNVVELVGVEHFLVAQTISILQPIQLEAFCHCSLERIERLKTKTGDIWLYQLEVYQEGLAAICETKIYVRSSNESI